MNELLFYVILGIFKNNGNNGMKSIIKKRRINIL